MIKSLFYFLVTPKPMDTTKNLDICSQFREITLEHRVKVRRAGGDQLIGWDGQHYNA